MEGCELAGATLTGARIDSLAGARLCGARLDKALCPGASFEAVPAVTPPEAVRMAAAPRLGASAARRAQQPGEGREAG